MLVGLSGYAGSGKDSYAELLVLTHGYKRYAIADKLKQVAYDSEPEIKEIVDSLGWERAKREIGWIRNYLQNLAWSIKIHLGDTVLIDSLKIDYSQPTVISDLRYRAEAEWVKNHNGVVIRVNSVGIEPVNDHISETDLDNWPFNAIIDGQETFKLLQEEIKRLDVENNV